MPKKGSHAQASRKPFRRIADWLLNRPRPIHLLMFVMFFTLGIAATTTVRSHTAEPLAGLSEDQLVALLADLQQREDDLREERRYLQNLLEELQEAHGAQEAAAQAAATAEERAALAAGTVPVEGPGVEMWVASLPDADQPLPAPLFITTMTELRNAGAEALSLNDVRLTGRSWFAPTGQIGDGQAIVADGQVVRSPFVWRAIGDADTLAMALEIRGGAADQFRAYGTTATLTKHAELQILPVAPLQEPKQAAVDSE